MSDQASIPAAEHPLCDTSNPAALAAADLMPMPVDQQGSAATPGSDLPKADPRLRTPDRHQVVFRYGSVDELVGPDHPVRIVWQVVDRLDLSAFIEPIRAREGNAGRAATDPRVLVALWLYATIRNVGSARELDRLCTESDPYKWILGGLTVNYHLLADFRVGHADALDALFTETLATLVDKDLVTVERIMQDGVRVRASAGADSFRSEERLGILLEESSKVVQDLRRQIDDPARSAEECSREKAACERAAREKQQRLEEAVAQLPDLKERREQAAERAGNGQRGKDIREKKVRVSTTDAEARVMKMPNGGFNPAYNVQLATDPTSRAIVGVEVTNEGADTAGLLEPMRQQVEARTGQKVKEHGADGGFLTIEDIEKARAQGVHLFVPPKTARNPDNRGKELEPKPGDSPAILEWKKRMASDYGKEVYKQRASSIETINGDLREHRALDQFVVRGLNKVKCAALWCALAYNVMMFGKHMIA
jgi:transposase